MIHDKTFTLVNGITVPKVGLGVYKMETEEEVVRAVHSAFELGYRHIDTASFYNNEEAVGKAIRTSSLKRENLFVTTKVWNDEQGYKSTLEAFERSRDKLGEIDLYLVHWPVPGKFTETWKAMEKLYQEGHVKAIGVCNFMQHHLQELFQVAEIKPMVNQVEFHPRLYLKELEEFCKKEHIQLEAWAPLARGRYFDDPVVQELAQRYDQTPAQIILRWHLEHDVMIIPKSSNRDRQEENFDLFHFSLTNEDVKRLDSLHREERIGKHPDEFDYE